LNGFNLHQVDPIWQRVIQGAVIFVAVADYAKSEFDSGATTMLTQWHRCQASARRTECAHSFHADAYGENPSAH